MNPLPLISFGRVTIYVNEQGLLKRGKRGKWKPASWILAGLPKNEARKLRSSARKAGIYTVVTAPSRPPKAKESGQ